MTDRTVTADDLLEMRRMKGLPNLAAQTAQAASALAKFAADRAMQSGAGGSHTAASQAFAAAESCIEQLIALETVLAESEDLPDMTERIAATLHAASSAVRAAGDALRRTQPP